jgi:hypothetical protein
LLSGPHESIEEFETRVWKARWCESQEFYRQEY